MRTLKNRVALGVVLAGLVFGATHNIRAELPQAIGTWASLGATPESRVGAAAVALKDGRTVIAGGSVDGVATDSVVAFDPNTGSFSIVGHLLLARVGHTATLLDDDRILIAGGTVGDLISADLELFDPAAGVSALGGAMAQPRTGHAAAKLANGKVLIVGGTSVDGVLQSAEVYDPETGTTTATVLPMLSPRTGASATTLIDGRVLVAGGNNGTVDLKSGEIFEPSSQIFAATTTTLSFARSGHAAVLLPNNNSVLIAGGSSNNVPVPTSDLFLPAEFPDPYSYGMGSFAQTSDLLAARSRAIASPHIEGYAVAIGGGAPEAEVYRFPTIKTDKDDYAPGTKAIITGSGWRPGEAVKLVFQEDPAVHDDYLIDRDSSGNPVIVADGNGEIYYDQWAPENHDLGVRFYLMAKQPTSTGERRAQTTFTDATNVQTNTTLNPISTPLGSGQTNVPFSGTVSLQSVTDPAIPSGGAVQLQFRAGSCNGNFALVTTATVNSAGQFSGTFTAPSAAGSYGYRAEYQGDSQGSGSSAVNWQKSTSACQTITVNSNTASISGTVYQDSNGNGAFDAGEPGIAGVSVSLSGTSSGSTATNGSGAYTFSSLAAGTYTVDYAVPAGYTNTGTKPITGISLSSGQTLTGQSLFARKTTSTTLTRTTGSSPSTYGDSLTFTATVTSAAGNPNNEGTVAFKDGTTTISTCSAVSLVGNTASCTVSTLTAAGSPHSITAAYSGTTTGNGFAASMSNAVSQSVTPKNLTISGAVANSRDYDGTDVATINFAAAVLAGVVGTEDVSINDAGYSAHFADKNIGTSKPVTVTGVALSGADAGNYTVSQPTGLTANITPKNLTISSAVANSRDYDGTDVATINFAAALLTGVIGTEDVSINDAGYSAHFADKNIGTSKPVTVTGVVLSGADAGNYTVSQPTGLTADITPKNLTISGAVANSRDYDGTDVATINFAAAVLAGVVGTEDVSINDAGYSAHFADKNIGTSKPVTVTGVALSGADAGNYTVSQPTGLTANITPKNLTISSAVANSRDYDGTDVATINFAAAVLAGVVGTEDVSINDAGYSAHFADKNIGTSKPVTVTGVALSGADAGNYTVSQPTGLTANITPKNLTISGAVANSRDYDGTDVATINFAAALLTGVIGTEDVSISDAGYSAHFADKNIGTSKPVTVTGVVLSGADAGNYTVSQPSGLTANITPKPLTVTGITANNKPWDGTTTATLNVSGAALVGVVSPDVVTLNTAGATGTFASANVGTWPVQVVGLTISGADSTNYSVTQPVTTATIGSWSLNGFYQPIAMGDWVLNTVKGGSTVPLKFNVYQGSTERTDVAAIKPFVVQPVPCSTNNFEDPIDFTTTGATTLRYDATGHQFIQNWQTPKTPGACYRVTMETIDGSKLFAFFRMK